MPSESASPAALTIKSIVELVCPSIASAIKSSSESKSILLAIPSLSESVSLIVDAWPRLAEAVSTSTESIKPSESMSVLPSSMPLLSASRTDESKLASAKSLIPSLSESRSS